MLPFVMGAILIAASLRSDAARVAMLALPIGLLFLCRQSYIVVLVAVPVAYLLIARSRSIARRSIPFLALLVAAAVPILLRGYLFPGSTLGYRDLLMSRGVGATGMAMYFGCKHTSFSIATMLSMGVGGVIETVLTRPLQLIVFYGPFNLLVLASLIVIWRWRSVPPRFRTLVGLSFAMLLVHFATSFFYNSQPRYILPVTPVLLVTVTVVSGRRLISRGRMVKVGAAAALMIFAGLGVGIARTAHQLSTEDARIRGSLAETVRQHIPAAEAVAVEGTGRYLLAAFVCRPRMVAFVRHCAWNPGAASEFLTTQQARWLLCTKGSPLIRDLGRWIVGSVALPAAWADRYALFRLDLPEPGGEAADVHAVPMARLTQTSR
jgi:hypothetical protein